MATSGTDVDRRRPWVAVGVPIDSVGAPDGGPPFGTEEAPEALRRRGFVERVGATDRGDLAVRVTGPDRDPGSGIVGYPSVREMTATVRAAVADVLRSGGRPLLMGGCCSLVMGAVAGLRDVAGRVGVVNVDGHVDAYDGRTSPTGRGGRHPGRRAARPRRRGPAGRARPGAGRPRRRRCRARGTGPGRGGGPRRPAGAARHRRQQRRRRSRPTRTARPVRPPTGSAPRGSATGCTWTSTCSARTCSRRPTT